jgi:hypothetical protein
MPRLLRSTLQLILLAASLFLSTGVWSHGGGLDKQGGHTDRKTGLYHCHSAACFEAHGDTVGPIGGDTDSAPFVLLYERDEWPHWIDEDRDCQDARAEVLIRDSLVAVTFAGNKRCIVEAGLWRDPYTGENYTSAAEMDIDHIVPLKWAHGHGGDRWPPLQKRLFANDTTNLVAVAASVNRQKGSKGPDDWMPPLKAYRCEYLGRFIAVMDAYRLRFVGVELMALQQDFQACGFSSGLKDSG